jgi:transcriptional regulator with XRE-family HTH domain
VLTREQREEFGGYLRGLRQGARMSLRCVHRETGISPGYLSLIERGDRNPPQPAFLLRLAACYRTPGVDLLRRAGYLTLAEAVPEPAEAGSEIGRGLLELARAIDGLTRALLGRSEPISHLRLVGRQTAEDVAFDELLLGRVQSRRDEAEGNEHGLV